MARVFALATEHVRVSLHLPLPLRVGSCRQPPSRDLGCFPHHHSDLPGAPQLITLMRSLTRGVFPPGQDAGKTCACLPSPAPGCGDGGDVSAWRTSYLSGGRWCTRALFSLRPGGESPTLPIPVDAFHVRQEGGLPISSIEGAFGLVSLATIRLHLFLKPE